MLRVVYVLTGKGDWLQPNRHLLLPCLDIMYIFVNLPTVIPKTLPLLKESLILLNMPQENRLS